MRDIKTITENLIDNVCSNMKQRLSDRLNDGTLDLSLYNDDMILPKAILLALMEKESDRYLGLTNDVKFFISKEKMLIKKVI